MKTRRREPREVDRKQGERSALAPDGERQAVGPDHDRSDEHPQQSSQLIGIEQEIVDLDKAGRHDGNVGLGLRPPHARDGLAADVGLGGPQQRADHRRRRMELADVEVDGPDVDRGLPVLLLVEQQALEEQPIGILRP
jgi:hypothetical protein